MRTSYNGWPASPDRDAIGIQPFVVAGVEFPGGVKGGDVATVLRYVMQEFHEHVEPLHDGWCWGAYYRQNRNSDNLSCHASGTAVDANAPAHPNGKRGTFDVRQRRVIRRILADCEGVVKWGEDFRGTPDGMHFEIAASPAQVAAVARKLTKPKPAPVEDDAMTPAQEKKLDRLLDLMEALVAPRDRTKKDKDSGAISLGDVLTVVEKETK